MKNTQKILQIILQIAMIFSLAGCSQTSGSTQEPEEIRKYRSNVESQLAQQYPGEEIIPIKARTLNDQMIEYVYEHDGVEVIVQYTIPGSPLDEMLANGELDEAYEKYYKDLDVSGNAQSNNRQEDSGYAQSSQEQSDNDDYVDFSNGQSDSKTSSETVKTTEITLDVMDTFSEMKAVADEKYKQASQDEQRSYRVMFMDSQQNEVYEIVYTNGVVEYQQFLFRINVDCDGKTVQLIFDPGRYYTDIDIQNLKSVYNVKATAKGITSAEFNEIQDSQIVQLVHDYLNDDTYEVQAYYYDFSLDGTSSYVFDMPSDLSMSGQFGGEYVDRYYLYPDFQTVGGSDILLRQQTDSGTWGNSIEESTGIQLVMGKENDYIYTYLDDLVSDLGTNPQDSQILEYVRTRHE